MVKTEPTDFHLEFSVAGRPVDLDTTVYGAIHTFDATSPESRRSIWQSIYTVKFRKVPGAAKTDSQRSSPEPASRDESMLKTLPASIPADSQQATILQLLWVLHTINSDFGDARDAHGVAAGLTEGAFVNNKLTAKLNRQLEEPMIVASACLPDWAVDLPQSFPFLFPFDTRYTFLQSTAFGYARLMQKWVGQAKADSSRRDDNLGFLGRLQRQKVRISRDRMLESAYKVPLPFLFFLIPPISTNTHSITGLRALRLLAREPRGRILRRSRERTRPDARVLRARLKGVLPEGPQPLATWRHGVRGDVRPPAERALPAPARRRHGRGGQEGPQGLPRSWAVRREGCVYFSSRACFGWFEVLTGVCSSHGLEDYRRPL